MKISKRLQAICDMVPNNVNVIDIGADHALTDIYLAKTKNCNCLATDISEKALENAKITIDKANVNVKTMVTDGLHDIELNDEIIILSGMGAHTIMKILDRNITNDIIVSAHTNIPELRKYMYKKGYHIKNEVAIKDKYYYIISYYEYGRSKKINYIISPFLEKNIGYMTYLHKYYRMKSQHETKIIKKLKYHYIVFLINKKIKRSS